MEKIALQIHSWQVNANIFKVMCNSLVLVTFIWFLCSLLHCRLQRKVKLTEECFAHYFNCIETP